MRSIETGPIFRMQRRKFGKKQKKELLRIIEQLKKSPEVGVQNKGDLEGIWGYLYENHLGKIYLGYKFDENSITLISLSRISIKI